MLCSLAMGPRISRADLLSSDSYSASRRCNYSADLFPAPEGGRLQPAREVIRRSLCVSLHIACIQKYSTGECLGSCVGSRASYRVF